RRGEGIGRYAARQCAGEGAVINHQSLLQTGTTDPGRSPWIGVTSDEAETLPDSESHTGKTPKSLSHHSPARVETHTARAQDSSTPVPWRWRSRGARIIGSHRPRHPPTVGVTRSAATAAVSPLGSTAGHMFEPSHSGCE